MPRSVLNAGRGAGSVPIASVERDTGLSQETLRAWERRYGFPAPERNAAGERSYPLDQVHKLHLLRRLVDAGLRPGRIVGLSVEELERLIDERRAEATMEEAPARLEMLLLRLKDHDVDVLRRQLRESRTRLGPARFVTEVVAPLSTRVGEAWMRGQLQVFEEHLFTESLQFVLRETITTLPAVQATGRPRVLLATLRGEPHGLGLLMAEVLLRLHGARCLSLGVEVPIWDIVLAARAQNSDIVGLSFAGCIGPNRTVEALGELRSKLPDTVHVWAGGTAPVLHRRAVSGVTAIAALGVIPHELAAWRRDRN